jgi:hypothetical protein
MVAAGNCRQRRRRTAAAHHHRGGNDQDDEDDGGGDAEDDAEERILAAGGVDSLAASLAILPVQALVRFTLGVCVERLKVLSNEIDPAEISLIRKFFI